MFQLLVERFKYAIYTCLHHGFDSWMLVFYFYQGMLPLMKQLMETIYGGNFMSKSNLIPRIFGKCIKDPIPKGEPRRTQNPTQSLNSGGILV